MQKRWLVKTPKDITTVEEFRSTLKIDRIVAELLLQRGINTYDQAENFFRPKLDQLHDPFLMKDLREAVERLNLAFASNEKILLFGDYDVDADGNLVATGPMIAFRGLFLIDKAGVVRHQLINDLPLGRNVDEAIRVLDALQFNEEKGEVCPANWSKGKEGMKADHKGVAEYLASH